VRTWRVLIGWRVLRQNHYICPEVNELQTMFSHVESEIKREEGGQTLQKQHTFQASE
jgi:hypothetical protein